VPSPAVHESSDPRLPVRRSRDRNRCGSRSQFAARRRPRPREDRQEKLPPLVRRGPRLCTRSNARARRRARRCGSRARVLPQSAGPRPTATAGCRRARRMRRWWRSSRRSATSTAEPTGR
jgi:hypothetical protein